MSDREQVQVCYEALYEAMLRKDLAGLAKILAEDFVLVHMTGLRQPKQVFIDAVLDGTLNYFSAEHERITVKVTGDWAALTGQSRVSAAVFGGGRGSWRLQLRITLRKTEGVWKMVEAVASTY